jgi:hypothetical protein
MRFTTPMNHALKCRDRLHVALRSGLQRLPDGPQTIFEIALSKVFLGEDTQDCQQTARQSAIDWAKVPFYIVPHLRGRLLVVARKP